MDREFLYQNIPYTITLLAGVIFLYIGLMLSAYEKSENRLKVRLYKIKRPNGILSVLLSGISKLPVLRNIKYQFKSNLEFSFSKDLVIDKISNVLILILASFSVLLIVLLNKIGQLWYVKVMITVMSVILPYYVMALALDLYKYKMNTQIPKVIDEFRSAFIEHNKIKPALRECSKHVSKNFGKILLKAADSSDTQRALEEIRDKFDNIWFSIFIAMLSNYKENGGELITQLYKLNNTMTTQNSIEKKKNKRLLWYELFAICASILSIPAALWLNRIILGNDVSIVDPATNLAICRVIAFSVMALVVARILRKM